MPGHTPRLAFRLADSRSPLRLPALRDGQRYRLLCWMVTPNHVHVIIERMPGCSLSNIVLGWKSYTAKEAYRVLGKKGQVWQEEYC